MSPDDGLLEDMLREARLSLEFVADLSENDFLHDTKTQYAVVRCLEIIGEAASRVSRATTEQLSAIPWSKVTGQRHVAIHHYRKLQMPRIWATVRDDVPALVRELGRYLETMP